MRKKRRFVQNKKSEIASAIPLNAMSVEIVDIRDLLCPFHNSTVKSIDGTPGIYYCEECYKEAKENDKKTMIYFHEILGKVTIAADDISLIKENM